MQKGVFLPPSQPQRRRCKEEAREWEAVHSQLSGSAGAGGSCLERIRGQWRGAALGARPSLTPAASRHGCSRRGGRSCRGSRAAWMHPLSSNTGGTCLPLALVGVVACVDGPWLDGRQLCVPPLCQPDHPAALQTAQFGSSDLELPRQSQALALLCAHQ